MCNAGATVVNVEIRPQQFPHPQAPSMHQVTCEGCGQSAPSYEIVRSGSSDGPYRDLCSRCFNMHAAQRAGLEGFEHVRLEPIRLTDSQGATHDFHFRSCLFGPGIALDAFEWRDGHPAGYRFRVIGEPEGDLLALLGRLIEKMRCALAVHHIEDTDSARRSSSIKSFAAASNRALNSTTAAAAPLC
jgi:hypothetical protein